MNTESKKMRWTLPDGGYVHLEWPDNITIESLEMVEQVLELQLRSVRKAIEKRKAPEQAPQDQGPTND